MKNILYAFLVVFFIGVFASSCDDANFLDETVTTDLDQDKIFQDSITTIGFLYNIYKGLDYDIWPGRYSTIHVSHGGLQTSCSEAEIKRLPSGTTDLQFITGTVNAVSVSDDAWSVPYEQIRAVNIFLSQVDNSDLSANRKRICKAEARFLRAFYYASMLRHYGGVPLIGEQIFEKEEDFSEFTRNTYAECVDYIVKELDEAASILPDKMSGRDFGRASGGACKALKARVLLYAASPLFNGVSYAPDYDSPELIGYPTYSKERWKDAMDAAAEVIGMRSYSLYVRNIAEGGDEDGWGFYGQFMAIELNTLPNIFSGHILLRNRGSGQSKTRWFLPPSSDGNGVGGYPYQELVDAFPMKNGKSINDPDSGYDPEDPYKDRDPRFDNTIIHDGTFVQSGVLYRAVNMYLNKNGSPASADAAPAGTRTGYFWRKMVYRGAAANHFTGSRDDSPVLRYSEVLLNYAEARNEYLDAPDEAIYNCLKDIREAGGIQAGEDGMYGIKPNMNKEEMKEFIRNERRIELALEGHRFFDVRRWMIAEQTENQQYTGMQIQIGSDDKKKYTRYNVRKLEFRKAMYLWPFPDSESGKLPMLKQNPYY